MWMNQTAQWHDTDKTTVSADLKVCFLKVSKNQDEHNKVEACRLHRGVSILTTPVALSSLFFNRSCFANTNWLLQLCNLWVKFNSVFKKISLFRIKPDEEAREMCRGENGG